MPYPQLEELTSRRREKVALFLTAENMAGLLAIGLPAYLGTLSVEIWLRILILIAAAVLGVALTTDVHGMACYERVLWWVRGRARRQMTGAVIRPAEFTPVQVVPDARALPVGGPLRRMPRRVRHPADTAQGAGGVRTAAVPRSRSQDASAMPGRVTPRVCTEVRRAGSARNGHVAPVAAMAVVVKDGDGNHG